MSTQRSPMVGKISRALSLRDLVDRTQPIRLPSPTERRGLRLNAGFSQEEAALAIGVSLRSIVAWENGTTLPHAESRLRYGSALAVFANLGPGGV
jgi:DNA-binding XRE family transcriptional regulator